MEAATEGTEDEAGKRPQRIAAAGAGHIGDGAPGRRHGRSSVSLRLARVEIENSEEDGEGVAADGADDAAGVPVSSSAKSALSSGRTRKLGRPAAKTRGMFAGLNLGAGRSRTDAQAFSRVKVATREAGMAPAAEQRGGRDELAQAVDGFARAWSDAARMRTANLPVLEHQKQALGRAGAALEAARPGGTRELLSALRHDPAAQRAMAGLEGAERAAQLGAGMERERQAQLDPNVRAERTVATWHKLEQEHGRLRGSEHEEARGQIEARMKTLAGAIKRDPQMESVMRARSRELGIERGSKLDRLTEEKNVERAINRSVTRERDLGMER